MDRIDDDFDMSTEVESEEDSSLNLPNLLDGVVVTDSDWTAETVLSQVSKGNIVLNPRFQRREAWDVKRKSRFIESLIIGLPVPQLVLAEVPGTRGRFLVIDGKQRLLALAKFAASTFAGEHYSLRSLDLRNDLNNMTWEEIRNDPRFVQDTAAFENAQIRTTIIRGWKNENALYLIFHRLNSGSVPLSPQELRHVLHPGQFIDFAFEYAENSDQLIYLLGSNGKPDFRMRDVELLIRFIGYRFFLGFYQGDLKDFLDTTVKSLNETWGDHEDNIRDAAFECDQAIAFTVDIFGEHDSFGKWSTGGAERRFNRAVFDVMTYYFADVYVRQKIVARKLGAEIVSRFANLCINNSRFRKSLESTTKSSEAVITRLWLWGRELEACLGSEMADVQALKTAAETYGL